MPRKLTAKTFNPHHKGHPGRPPKYNLSKLKLPTGQISLLTAAEITKLGFTGNALRNAYYALRREVMEQRGLNAARFGINREPEGVYVDLTEYDA